MDYSIDDILTSLYELEGLLLVAKRRGAGTPDAVSERIEGLSAAIARCCAEMSSVKETPVQESQPEPEVVPVEDREPDDDITVEFIEAEDEPEKVDEVPEQSDVQPTTLIEPQEERQPESLQQPQQPVVQSIQTSSEPISVEQQVQRTMSRDLRKAFSLNDRFRFRRELFENNEVTMNNALDLIEAMKSYNEAEEYFFEDLGWDNESDEVKDFMAIVRNHFIQ